MRYMYIQKYQLLKAYMYLATTAYVLKAASDHHAYLEHEIETAQDTTPTSGKLQGVNILSSS